MQTYFKNKFWEFNETVGQHFIDLMVNLLAMVIVARSFNLAGFGVFSYLVALLHIASFVSEAGICDRFRNRFALEIQREESLKDAAGALFCTGMITCLFFLITAFFDTSHTHIEERVVAYFLIAAAVPLRNGNRLRTTLLHVSGKHRDASRLQVKKYAFFLVVIWVVSLTQQPSLLVAAFLFSEIYQRVVLRKKVKNPRIFQPSFFGKAYQTVRLSLRHLFSGEALNLIFHADLFILGLFTVSAELGIYAEAALLGRFFLLVPVGLRPILHRHFAKIAAAQDVVKFSKSVYTIRAYMFYVHALLAMFLTSFFDDTIHVILGFYGSETASYNLLVIMLPGFLFYAAAIVNESALEASGNAPFLSRITAAVIGLNVLLSFYLIPFAGTIGAAWSTFIALLIYFFSVCVVKITAFSRIPVLEFLAAGAVVYLFDRLLGWVDISLVVFLIAAPPTLYLVFYLLNFFDFDDYHVTAKSNLFSQY
jgi:O-antigen/teichoic acid export membrane protein